MVPKSPHGDSSKNHPESSRVSRLYRSASVPKLFQRKSPPLPPPLPNTSPQCPQAPKGGVRLRKVNLKQRLVSDEVPYPLSYEKNILNCDALDNAAFRILRGSCSWVDFTDRKLPTRCLDLGCGPGGWILEAAREWPDCEFVGFDLVSNQVAPQRLEGTIGKRIRWVHGNFLKPLPFEDQYFDHVHICQIARGVPESKWDDLIAEVVRVLKVGGHVEIFEEDIIFPILPRSATAGPRKINTSSSSSAVYMSKTKQLSSPSSSGNDHAVLETLFYRVFERRFINVQPTALIMGTLDVHLRQASSSPLLNFPFPAAPVPSHCNKRASNSYSHTPCVQRFGEAQPDPETSQTGDSRSSTPVPEKRFKADQLASSSPSPALRSGSSMLMPPTLSTEIDGPSASLIAFYSNEGLGSCSVRTRSKNMGENISCLLPEEKLDATAGTLGLHFYRRLIFSGVVWTGFKLTSEKKFVLMSWQGVMACREAIWDEYLEATQCRDSLLEQLDWEEDGVQLSDRQRFEVLMHRYKCDMEARYSIKDALVSDLHWHAPSREVNPEDKQRRKALTEAWLRLELSGIGAAPEATRVCRKGRFFIATRGAGYVSLGTSR